MNAEKPIFEIRYLEKNQYLKIYENGTIEGFEPGAIVVNHIPSYIRSVFSELWVEISRLRKKAIEPSDERKMLENLQDRAFNKGLPKGGSGVEFVDYIRGLYPELYTKIKPTE